MLLEPALLSFYKLVNEGFIWDGLGFPFEKVRDVVPEKIVGYDEGFLTLLALLTRVRYAIGVIVVLWRGPTQDALLLELDQVVDIVRKLLQLRESLSERDLVHRSRVHLSSSYKVPLRKDLLAPQEIVRQEAKDSVSPTRPVFDRDLDSEAAELLIVTVPHSNILYIKDYQRRSTHRADCILLLTLLLLRWGR